jgi:hypothetical protein
MTSFFETLPARPYLGGSPSHSFRAASRAASSPCRCPLSNEKGNCNEWQSGRWQAWPLDWRHPSAASRFNLFFRCALLTGRASRRAFLARGGKAMKRHLPLSVSTWKTQYLAGCPDQAASFLTAIFGDIPRHCGRLRLHSLLPASIAQRHICRKPDTSAERPFRIRVEATGRGIGWRGA